MGEYTPNAPSILGQEWVGIRNAGYPLDLATERGHTLRIPTTSVVVSGAYYLEDTPTGEQTWLTPMVSLYRRGEENRTGPIRKVTIPCSGGTSTNVGFVGGITVAESLVDRGDLKYMTFVNPTSTLDMTFDVTAYAGELSGKRILNVDLVYTASGSPPDNVTTFFSLTMRSATPQSMTYSDTPPVAPLPFGNIPGILRVGLGNINHFTTPELGDQRRYPWRYPDLARLATGASNPLTLRWVASGQTAGPPSVQVNLFWAALEVTYCEESRIAYGGWAARNLVLGTMRPHAVGQNVVQLRTAANAAVTGATLQPGDYTVLVSLADGGDLPNGGTVPVIRAVEQLYELPTHEGVQLFYDNRWRDLKSFAVRAPTVTPGESVHRASLQIVSDVGTPERTTIDVLPQVTLHTASAVVTGVHAYGVSFGLPVYDGVPARQSIVQRSGGTAVPYTQVRFYARRFGETDVALTLFRTSAPAEAVTIDAATFDALPEVVEGWREVTLRFPTGSTPTFANTGALSEWTWQATGLLPNNQWRVLAADAPAVTGTWSIGPATYGGEGAVATWNGAADSTADAVLLFSQEPAAVTGLAVAETAQELLVVDPDCGLTPECAPTGIRYNRLSWTAFSVLDDFSRAPVAAAWGPATSGQSTTATGGSAGDYFTVAGFGRVTMASVNVSRRVMYDTPATVNTRMEATFSIDQVAVGAAARAAIMLRVQDVANDHYRVQVNFETDGSLNLTIAERAGGSDTTHATVTIPGTYAANTEVSVIAEVIELSNGAMIVAKAWLTEGLEPTQWMAFARDLTLVGALPSGFRFLLATGNTNVSPVFSVSDVRITNLDVLYVELQRRDNVGNEWQTIMRAYDTATATFADYEPRVGLPSHYRARTANAREFLGQWSIPVTGTPAAPGVLGAEDGNSVLIFTSNEVQDGGANLAYVMTWEGDVDESFQFPEAGDVVTERLFRRDFTVVHRPDERGGERFSRVLIVQNAAVPTGRIRDGFTSLRDMAWEDISYVCVRNELGDRWFAAVQVPGGSVRRNRRLYLAQVEITEVTGTPSVVEVRP